MTLLNNLWLAVSGTLDFKLGLINKIDIEWNNLYFYIYNFSTENHGHLK